MVAAADDKELRVMGQQGLLTIKNGQVLLRSTEALKTLTAV